jgi:DNA replication protein DnaC
MTAVTNTPVDSAEVVTVRLRNQCPECGKVTETDLQVDNFVAQLMVGRSSSKHACHECADKKKAEENIRLAQLRVEDNLRNSGIGEEFLGTWDSTIGNRQLANAIRQNVNRHLFIVGEYGVGKSRSACVNLERLIKAGKRGKYHKFNELAREYAKVLKEDDNAPKRLFAEVLRDDVIIVDDLCKKEQVSRSAAEFCYEFLDYIYEHDVKCRVWFTSNHLPSHLHRKFESKDLASAVASRLDRLHDAGKLVLIKAEDLGK